MPEFDSEERAANRENEPTESLAVLRTRIEGSNRDVTPAQAAAMVDGAKYVLDRRNAFPEFDAEDDFLNKIIATAETKAA